MRDPGSLKSLAAGHFQALLACRETGDCVPEKALRQGTAGER